MHAYNFVGFKRFRCGLQPGWARHPFDCFFSRKKIQQTAGKAALKKMSAILFLKSKI